jgi:dienelactone hydrolase
MQPRCPGRLAVGLVVGLTVAGAAYGGQATEKAAPVQGEKVRFDTVDQVELHGTFYPSSRGTKGPCVMFLHELGGNSQQEGWNELAAELQKKGYAVLAFDFRGHGDSTGVGSSFWQDRTNQTLKGFSGTKARDKISHKDFNRLEHYLMLVNDIAAAKRFLDRKNDSQECNSADTVVIGAGSGATLGALWVYSEWIRRNAVRNPLGFVVGSGEPEGKNIACAVWLSLSPTIRTQTLRVQNWFQRPVREKVPVYFIVGENDKTASLAKLIHDRVIKAPTDKNVKNTGMKAIPGSNKLSGRELLGKKSLGTEELIGKYIDKVMEDRGASAWAKKEVDKHPLTRVPFEAFVR